MNPVTRDRLLRSPEPLPMSRCSDEEIAALRALTYAEYLWTPYWRWRRRRALWLSRYHCENCGTWRGILNVHHLTYERLGEERDDDLVTLCRPCHEFVDHSTAAGRERYCPMPDDVRQLLRTWEERDRRALARGACEWDG